MWQRTHKSQQTIAKHLREHTQRTTKTRRRSRTATTTMRIRQKSKSNQSIESTWRMQLKLTFAPRGVLAAHASQSKKQMRETITARKP